jgi:uncharacterized protein YegL
MYHDRSKSIPTQYADIDFGNNAQRLPLVMCLDTSKSMSGPPMEMLNEALRSWTGELRSDVSLSNSVEIALVTFGGQQVTAWKGAQMLPRNSPVSPFVSPYAFDPPVLAASGVTLMTEALELAMQLVAARKAELRQAGHQYLRPQICLVTDGVPTDPTGLPTDSWRRIVPTLAAEQQAKRFRLYAIGVGGITPQGEQVLQAFAPKFNASLQGFPFRALLQMMSSSASAQQRGDGEEVYEKIFAQLKTQRSAWDT